MLVTSTFHMPRSLATFHQRSGLQVVPVACDYQPPEAEALHLSTVALKEHLGLAVYRLRGWS